MSPGFWGYARGEDPEEGQIACTFCSIAGPCSELRCGHCERAIPFCLATGSMPAPNCLLVSLNCPLTLAKTVLSNCMHSQNIPWKIQLMLHQHTQQTC